MATVPAPTGAGGTTDPPDATTAQVLSALLRLRPRTLAEVGELRSFSARSRDAALAELIQMGFVSVDGDRVEVRDPVTAVSGQSDRLAGLLGALPSLLRDWSVAAGTQGADVEVIHGHEEQWRAWARHAAQTPPRAPLNLYPSLDVLRDVILPDLEANLADHPQARLRAVLPAAVTVAADDRAVLDALTTAGVAVRIVDRLDSWVYADAGRLAAVPLRWAEHPPSSIMIVREPAIIAVVSAYAAQFWQRGRDWPLGTSGWAGVLDLMALGLSDTAISSSLGLSLRTVQRRIADAMEHFGVTSRFALGAAWAGRAPGRPVDQR